MKRPPWGPLPWRRFHPDPVDHSWDLEDVGPLDLTPAQLTRIVTELHDRWPNDFAPADSDPGRLYGHY